MCPRSSVALSLAPFYTKLLKCLKKSRSKSHPERSIGQTQTPRTPSSSSSSSQKYKFAETASETTQTLVSWVLDNVTRLIDINNGNVNHYFMMCLLLDTLKSGDIPTAKSAEFGELVLKHLLSDKVWTTYPPSMAKLWDIINFLSGDKYLIKNSQRESDTGTGKNGILELCVLLSIDLVDCITSGTSLSALLDLSAQQHTQDCKLINSSVDSSLFAVSFKNSLILTNQVRKYHTTKSLFYAQKTCLVLHDMIDGDDGTFSSVLSLLMANDQDVIDVLLCFAELELRNTNTITITEITTETEEHNSMEIVKGGIFTSTITLFIWWITIGLMKDISLLFDLITSPETAALEYLLRATKCFVISPDETILDSFEYISKNQRMFNANRNKFPITNTNTKSSKYGYGPTRSMNKVSVWLIDEQNTFEESISKKQRTQLDVDGSSRIKSLSKITSRCWDEQEQASLVLHTDHIDLSVSADKDNDKDKNVVQIEDIEVTQVEVQVEEFGDFIQQFSLLLDSSKGSCPFDPSFLIKRLNQVLTKLTSVET